jgi:large subunit ribosomal protein L13
MKTYQPKKNSIVRRWHLVDAKDKVLGRLATEVARTLMGKGKPSFTPHVDCGDHVVIINAEGIRITGNNKPVQKIDFRHSGYPGGETITPYGEFLKSKPDRAIYLAVSGMLSKNRLRARQLARLKVYKGSTHPHGAQFAAKAKTESAAAPAAQG